MGGGQAQGGRASTRAGPLSGRRPADPCKVFTALAGGRSYRHARAHGYQGARRRMSARRARLPECVCLLDESRGRRRMPSCTGARGIARRTRRRAEGVQNRAEAARAGDLGQGLRHPQLGVRPLARTPVALAGRPTGATHAPVAAISGGRFGRFPKCRARCRAKCRRGAWHMCRLRPRADSCLGRARCRAKCRAKCPSAAGCPQFWRFGIVEGVGHSSGFRKNVGENSVPRQRRT